MSLQMAEDHEPTGMVPHVGSCSSEALGIPAELCCEQHPSSDGGKGPSMNCFKRGRWSLTVRAGNRKEPSSFLNVLVLRSYRY